MLTALAITTMTLVVLLVPGEKSVPTDSFMQTFFSMDLKFFDWLEAVVHCLLFSFLTLVWYRAFFATYPAGKSLLFAVGLCASLGIATEFAQFFIARSSMLIDMAANLSGIALIFSVVHRLSKKNKASISRTKIYH